jgi:hypothetical protein
MEMTKCPTCENRACRSPGCCAGRFWLNGKYDGQNGKFNRQAIRCRFRSEILRRIERTCGVCGSILPSALRHLPGHSDWLHNIGNRLCGHGIRRSLPLRRRASPAKNRQFGHGKGNSCGSDARFGPLCELRRPASERLRPLGSSTIPNHAFVIRGSQYDLPAAFRPARQSIRRRSTPSHSFFHVNRQIHLLPLFVSTTAAC